MRPLNRRRLAQLTCPVAVCAAIAMAFSAAPAQADMALTQLDNIELAKVAGFGHGHGFTNQDYKDYCSQAGFGTGWGQCAVIKYAEESRAADMNYHKVISQMYTNCNKPGYNDLAMRSDGYTNSATWKIGLKVSAAVKIEFDEAPLGVGAKESTVFSTGVSTDVTWGDTVGETESYFKTIPPGHRGWLEYWSYHGTSHGLVQVEIIGAMKPGVYRSGGFPYAKPSSTPVFPVDISGDLPKPIDPAVAAQQSYTGILPQLEPVDCAKY
ncbi:hypothetical protein AB0N17_45515 [Streptomyces sp. NPDC051133]|uniref:hypothetical protein n=1 Tax=Streptomyces sp. NPDC051133 TaxID=3155521 RepID=UPI00342AA10E